ncbi:uncharacterized protein [Aegilops tauschii subsp. strangulata]|nr:uncharacterized protein LOC109778423 [Aegilops tauschii subsp. strangulata]
MAPQPTSLPDADDLLREILLRLPPRPSSLPRASLVCKRWRSLVTDPQFQRRFRDHHGKRPLLGFFIDDRLSCPFFPMLDRPDRISGARFSMPPNKDDRIVDCRHGLVLFVSPRPPRRLVVWDPVVREQRRLIFPPELESDQMHFNGAVLRPALGQGCRSSYFQVALLALDRWRTHTRVSVCLYSSDTGIWSNINSLQLQSFISTVEPSTLIGNSFCWLLTGRYRHVILEFDLDRQSLAVTELPPQVQPGHHNLRILPAGDGGLGFIHLSKFHGQLWKREPDSVWVLDRAIGFEQLRSTCNGDSLTLVGVAEESNAILVRAASRVFMVYLQSMEFKKVFNMRFFYHHYPFACCYAAVKNERELKGG